MKAKASETKVPRLSPIKSRRNIVGGTSQSGTNSNIGGRPMSSTELLLSAWRLKETKLLDEVRSSLAKNL